MIVQMAGFTKGEVLLFERLQMPSMLLEKYAKEGGERERRQMLAMCCSDPELLADVLSYFVAMASQNVEVCHVPYNHIDSPNHLFNQVTVTASFLLRCSNALIFGYREESKGMIPMRIHKVK